MKSFFALQSSAYQEPDGAEQLLEDVGGVGGHGRDPAAPQHRVQPGLVHRVQGQAHVALGELSGRHAGAGCSASVEGRTFLLRFLGSGSAASYPFERVTSDHRICFFCPTAI